MKPFPVAPYDPSRYIGTVSQITPTSVVINLPRAVSPSGHHHAGFSLEAGQVGEFVVIEGDEYAILGRISEVRLPERERLKVEPLANVESEQPNPLGICQLLASLHASSGRVIRGIPSHPRVGQHVFSAHPLLVKHSIESAQTAARHRVRLARVPNALNTPVSFGASALFGRHLAVLGATGGGKSWTVARLAEEIIGMRGKAILFDATGEFHTLNARTRHLQLGGQPRDAADTREFCCVPFWELSELDLFAIFQPSAGSQGPKLREALKSLKLAHIEPRLAPRGVLIKTGTQRVALEARFAANARAISAPGARFDITHLISQIQAECIFQTDRNNAALYGGTLETELGYVTTLLSRVALYTTTPELACIFAPAALLPLTEAIDAFMVNPDLSILRINLEELPFEHNTREVVLNAIGRHLLSRARAGAFRRTPLVAMLDEAHQFLNRTIGDDSNRHVLESFGLIAKEGRKYGLTCVLSTQRPRDIPEDVLSQVGMFIVHRLVNERDRATVEKACGSLDVSAASFLPTLMEGEAVVVGIDSPMPMPLLIEAPASPPSSRGPNYDVGWP